MGLPGMMQVVPTKIASSEHTDMTLPKPSSETSIKVDLIFIVHATLTQAVCTNKH
jgi:hypothetical protein